MRILMFRWVALMVQSCFDGTEVCELVGSYILQQLSQLLKHQSVGLYRDDGIAILKGLSGPEIETIKKKVTKVFNNCGLKITIKANLHVVNFLDITLDLPNETYETYRKPDNHPV